MIDGASTLDENIIKRATLLKLAVVIILAYLSYTFIWCMLLFGVKAYTLTYFFYSFGYGVFSLALLVAGSALVRLFLIKKKIPFSHIFGLAMFLHLVRFGVAVLEGHGGSLPWDMGI